jgi:serine/threonine-protein kinase HipA
MSADGEWKLAPAYDITHAHRTDGRWTSRHQMSVNGKTEEITVPDLYAVGDRFNVPGYKDAVARVRDAVRRWEQHADRAGLPAERAAAIRADIAANSRL